MTTKRRAYGLPRFSREMVFARVGVSHRLTSPGCAWSLTRWFGLGWRWQVPGPVGAAGGRAAVG
jgi:hypothetical protein